MLRRRGRKERRFEDRSDAGRSLLEAIRAEGLSLDLVLAIPRGGLPVAAVIARSEQLPLDVLIARKVGTPGQPELAMGAVTRFGAIWNASVLELISIEPRELDWRVAEEQEEVRRREAVYREPKAAVVVRDRRVLIVDDGLATGATMGAAVEAVQAAGAANVVVGVPVASLEGFTRLEAMGAQVVAVFVATDFFGVGQFYRDFRPVSEAECVESLERARRSASAGGPNA